MNFHDNFNHLNFLINQIRNVNVKNNKFICEMSDYSDFSDCNQIFYLMNLQIEMMFLDSILITDDYSTVRIQTD